MKNIFKVFIITAGIVLFYNVNSFAIVDGAVWGGAIFNGTVEGNSKAEPKGYDYGIKAHYNTSLIPMVELGIGAYYMDSKIKFGLDTDPALSRESAGLDINVILSLPIIHPYLRGTYAFWDKFEKDTKKYKAYGYGGGIEVTVFPFIRIFGEYMYDSTDHDGVMTTNTANFGLKLDI